MNPSGDLIVLLVVLAIIAAAMLPRQWRPSGTAYGTARWANMDDLRRAGMIRNGEGLILGKTRTGRLIKMSRYIHTAIFSPAGGGKTVSFSTVWLLTKRGSIVVNDPKGELYRLTAHIRRAMGEIVVRLDPFEVCGAEPDTFNPLDLIRDDCVDDVRALAEAMVIRTGEEKDPHWNDQGANVIAALLAFICAEITAEERNFSSLRDLIALEDLRNAAVESMKGKGGIYARMAGVIDQLEDKEKAGVLSTAHRHTTFLDSPAIIKSVSKSSFDAR